MFAVPRMRTGLLIVDLGSGLSSMIAGSALVEVGAVHRRRHHDAFAADGLDLLAVDLERDLA